MSACDAVHELLVAHALGALEASEAALVGEHLAECGPCRAADAEARADLAEVEAPPVAPPPLAWSRIRARVAAGRAGDEPARGPELADPSDSQALIALSCSFCRGALVRASSVYCASCLAPHHPECWREYGRCSVMGCGEERVVRPTQRPDVAPAPVAVPAAGVDKAARHDELERRRRLRRRWAGGGGLIVVLTGGLAAAALTPSSSALHVAATDEPATQPAPTVSTTPPEPLRSEPRFDVAVRDASLGELCAALEREAGARIDLSAGVTDLLLREGRWRARTWPELLREVARERGLVLREDAGRLGLSGSVGGGERATSTLERRTTQLLELPPRWRLVELRSGPPHEVAVAPAGRAIALLEGKSVRLITADRDATLTFEAPFERALWTDDGARVALWGRSGLAVVDVADGPPEVVERSGEVPAHVAWGPSPATRPLTISSLGGHVSDRALAQERPAHQRLVEPLRQGAFLEVALLPDASRFTLLETPPPEPGAPRRGWSFDVPVARPAIDLSLDRSRLLVTGEDVRLYETTSGEPLGDPIPRHSRSTFRADLSPDGARLAWIDDGLLVARRLAPDGREVLGDVQVVLAGGGAVAGCAWRGDGQALALWTYAGEVGVVDAATLDDALDDARGTLVASVQLTNPVDGVAWGGDVRWFGDALVVTSTRSARREPRVLVAPSGAQRPDMVVDIDWTTPDGAAPAARIEPTPPPATEPAPPVTEPAPPPVTEPAPPPVQEPDPASAPAPIPPALAHVRPGQRYTFRGHQGEVRTWEVLEVTAEGVVYREAVTLAGASIGDPRRETWRLARPEQVVRAGEPRRARREVAGAALDCLVFQVGDTTRWVAVTDDGWQAFPGEVRYERGGTVMLELTSVQQP